MPNIAHHKHAKQRNHTLPINRIVMVVAIAEPLMTIPQIYNIWILGQTAGVSLATWSFFTIAAATWLLYGLSIKNTPLIISGSLWLILESIVVLGILIK